MNEKTLASRLKLLLFKLGTNPTKFARNCGFTSQSLVPVMDKNTKISYKTLEKILIGYKNINARWLITGEGSMFMVDQDGQLNEPETEHKKICPECESKQRTIDALTKSVNNQDLLIKKCNEELQKFHNSEKRKAV